ncbi:MAG: hypothetical protein HY462_00845 [Parcubacteria group bacterium]|nr:hypothetical protein [Parcubacteria group bacterium]
MERRYLELIRLYWRLHRQWHLASPTEKPSIHKAMMALMDIFLKAGITTLQVYETGKSLEGDPEEPS